MLKPYTISVHVYADSDDEAQALENELLLFVKKKYDNGIYVRASALTKLAKQYGDASIINPFIR